jgi:hypothetical protein
MDLWQLVYGGDPRFAGLLELLQSGSASEFAVLFETSGRIQDLNAVYELYRQAGATPPVEDFCPLIYGAAGAQPNTYFVSLQAMDGNPWQTVFAKINYDSLVESSRAESAAGMDAAMERGAQRTEDAVKQVEAGSAPPTGFTACSH